MNRRFISVGLAGVGMVAAICLGVVLLTDDDESVSVPGSTRDGQQSTDRSERSKQEAALQDDLAALEQDVVDLQQRVRRRLRRNSTNPTRLECGLPRERKNLGVHVDIEGPPASICIVEYPGGKSEAFMLFADQIVKVRVNLSPVTLAQ